MKHRSRYFCAVTAVLILLSPFVAVSPAGEPAGREVQGTLTEVGGLPVLRVWGTPEERGYAHGYLLGEKCVALFDGLLTSGFLGGSIEGYERRFLPKMRLMKIDEDTEAEVRGFMAGVEARLGGPAEVPSLGRPLKYDDMLAIQCTGDFVRMGCSSFAAWGEMTKDGHTLGGRNMDWPRNPALLGSQIIMVQVPAPDSATLGWVAVTWPGYFGCITGMNAEGVTVSTHDANTCQPSITTGFAPYVRVFRKAIETARSETMIEDIARVIRGGVCAVGNNMMATRPYTGKGPGAVVFEFDGDSSNGQGVTIRQPKGEQSHLICTNHFRERSKPVQCGRYGKLSKSLDNIAKRRGKKHLTRKKAWKMLRSVTFEQIISHHSVVFEPNKRLMHVAFAVDGKQAPRCKKVTLNVAELLAGRGGKVEP